ncbi:MAG: glycosyltransferase family 9 protein [Pseudomonadota bacterium]
MLRKYYPNSIIDVVSRKPFALQAWEKNPDINHTFHKGLKYTIKRLAKNYDLIFEKAGIIDKAFLIKNNISYLIEEGHHEEHSADSLLKLTAKFLNHTISEADRHYFITFDFDAIEPYLKDKGDSILVGIQLGNGATVRYGSPFKFFFSSKKYKKRTKKRAKKLWDLDHYVNFCEQFKEKRPNTKFILTGTKQEQYLANQFTNKFPDVINCVGKTSIPSLAALIDSLDIFITHDTGSLHVASASNTPIVSLFSKMNFKRYGPYPYSSERHKIIFNKDGMSHISPDEVLQVTLTMLQGQQH